MEVSACCLKYQFVALMLKYKFLFIFLFYPINDVTQRENNHV